MESHGDWIKIVSDRFDSMVRIQKRISDGLEVLQYFTTREWIFHNTNLLILWGEMNSVDKKLFPIDFLQIDVMNYLKDVILGARQYCMKESLESLPKARFHHKMYVFSIYQLFLTNFFLRPKKNVFFSISIFFNQIKIIFSKVRVILTWQTSSMFFYRKKQHRKKIFDFFWISINFEFGNIRFSIIFFDGIKLFFQNFTQLWPEKKIFHFFFAFWWNLTSKISSDSTRFWFLDFSPSLYIIHVTTVYSFYFGILYFAYKHFETARYCLDVVSDGLKTLPIVGTALNKVHL